MEAVYKVLNMPLIVANIIHVAVSEEVVALVDHHSVDVEDLSQAYLSNMPFEDA